MNSIIQYLNPFVSTFDFYSDYLKTIKKIQIERDRWAIVRQSVIIFALVLASFHLLHLALNSSLTDLSRLLLYDAGHYSLSGSFDNNLIISSTALMVARLEYEMHFRDNFRCARLFKRLINFRCANFLTADSSKQRELCQRLRSCFLLVYNCNKWMWITRAIFLGMIHVEIIAAALGKRPWLTYGWAHFIIVHTISAVLFDLTIVQYTSILAITISTSIGQMMMFILKLGQLTETLKARIKLKQSLNGRWIHRQLVETLHYFAGYNRFYGRIFLIYMEFNGPTNAYIMMLVIFGNISPKHRLSFLLGASTQLVCIFGLHYYARYFSAYFHQPSSLLTSALAQNNQTSIKHFRQRLKLSDLVEALHTENRYGFSYGRICLVTLKTFLQFVFIYSKLIMITYKIVMRN